jgi:hypothetical protein
MGAMEAENKELCSSDFATFGTNLSCNYKRVVAIIILTIVQNAVNYKLTSKIRLMLRSCTHKMRVYDELRAAAAAISSC